MAAVVKALDPRAIEAEISRIRERESNPYHSGMKTNLFNLVIFRSAPPAAAVGALESLLGKRPARIITVEPAAAGRTSASVSGRCYPDPRNRGVCFEEIDIKRGSEPLGSDPGIWTPLLIRDLPVLVWWQDRVSPLPPLLTGEAGLVDKLIIDTSFGESLGEDPLEALAEVAGFRSLTGGTAAVSDMSWRRTLALRVQAARMFEPEENRPLLSSISHVTLRGGSGAEALLFFLWLASRLGWSPVRSKRSVFTDPAGTIVETRHSAPAPLCEGFAAAFAFRHGVKELSVSCGQNGCVSMDCRKAAYRFPSDGETLMDEVDSLGQDGLFSKVVDAVGGQPRT
jgi:glucose-6-phosphate dehydrogenase assembly protein OpcA